MCSSKLAREGQSLSSMSYSTEGNLYLTIIIIGNYIIYDIICKVTLHTNGLTSYSLADRTHSLEKFCPVAA